jgi:REP element-mobilizing transposase RayT
MWFMARPLRIEYPGALYHITSRGDRQEAIFDDDQDRTGFLNILSLVASRYRWRCHAYCPMGNHDLIINTPEANLTKPRESRRGIRRRQGLEPTQAADLFGR